MSQEKFQANFDRNEWGDVVVTIRVTKENIKKVTFDTSQNGRFVIQQLEEEANQSPAAN